MNLVAVPEDASSDLNDSLPALNRRRSLFPCDAAGSESDSDLGVISPLNFNSSNDQDFFKALSLFPNQKAHQTVGDYDIIEVVENQSHLGCTPQGKSCQLEFMSPLYLSPHCNKMETSLVDTPSKMSPLYKLKTPHDSNTNSKLPKLSRKSLLDSEVSSHSNKRKLSPDKSPEQNKQIKLDPKSSRVRTTLFPEVDFALSTKSFYPKPEKIIEKIMNNSGVLAKSSLSFATNRKYRSRKKMGGQINAGVRHKIRKPKQKMPNKTLVRDTLTSMGSKAITDYILDIKKLKSNDQLKLIDNKENSDPPQKLITSDIIPVKNTEPPRSFKSDIFPSNSTDAAQNVLASTKLSEKHSEQPQKLITPAIIPGRNIESKKRQLAPNPEPDPNRKFFKFSRAKGVVNMNTNTQIEIDQGKLSHSQKNKEKTVDFDMSDLSVEDSDLAKTNIENILSTLEDYAIPDQNKIILQASNSVVTSENSIMLHHPICAADSILSPISQMCDVTSELALNTPKKVRNLTPILEEMVPISEETCDAQKETEQNQEKVFPIFYPGYSGTPGNKVKARGDTEKKFKKLSKDQMLLDAGQKKFGITQCPECDYLYHQGDPSDEILHTNIHSGRHVLRFVGWRNERIVANFPENSRIIQILPGDSKIWWKKVNELMDFVNMQIGCYNMELDLNDCQVFLYIKKKTIIGCLVAAPKSEGYQLLGPVDNNLDLCTKNAYPVKCGIVRIWVSVSNRRNGVATQLMNTVKRHFIQGSVLNNVDIAFSSPTDMGKEFAQKFFKTKQFFVYL